MEYMSVKGSVELLQACDHDRLKVEVFDELENISFLNDEGIVTSKVKDGRLWLLGEGLMKETESNRLIAIVNRIYGFSDSTCRIDVQRIRWELNIIIGHESLGPGHDDTLSGV